jgi:hypothetical protein
MTKGRDLAATKAQLRHKSVKTTMKYDQVPVEDRQDGLTDGWSRTQAEVAGGMGALSPNLPPRHRSLPDRATRSSNGGEMVTDAFVLKIPTRSQLGLYVSPQV